MALKNKLQVRNLIRRLIDDPAGKQWPTADLDELIEASLDELWGGELLERFPWLTSAEETLTLATTPALTSPSGTITLSTLTNRFYRVQLLTRDNIPYRIARQDEVLVVGPAAVQAPDFTYTIVGDALWAFPFSTSSALTLRYSYLPEPFTSLSPGPDPDNTADDDISFVPWPDGFHMVYIYDVAAKAIEKGDKEESAKLQKRAEQSLYRLKAYLRKQHVGPLMAKTTQDEIEWGGV